MINRTEHPAAWAMLLYELADAHEHLGDLIQNMSRDADYGEPELRIALGHVYAHLNRAWRRRSVAGDWCQEDWRAAGQFPDDLQPIA